jgi:FMN-dependent NADH-azoreductase
MSNLLVVTSSATGEAADSSILAQHFAKRWSAANRATVKTRALTAETMPLYSSALGKGLATPATEQSEKENQAVALSNILCSEVLDADVIVVAAPMYTLTIPSALKAWLEYINRPGLTFDMTEQGPRGRLGDKHIVLICTRGTVFQGPLVPLDFQVPFLRAIFGFFGVTNISLVIAEGLAHGEEDAKRALTAARQELDRLAEKPAASK